MPSNNSLEPTRRAAAVDPYGRPWRRWTTRLRRTTWVVAQVPTHRVFTLYSIIGDLFAWLCVAGLLLSIGTGIYRRVRVR